MYAFQPGSVHNNDRFLKRETKIYPSFTDRYEITLLKILITSCQPRTRFQAPKLKVVLPSSEILRIWRWCWLFLYQFSPLFLLRICLAPLMTYLQERKQLWVQQLVHQVLQAAKGSRATQHSHLSPLIPPLISPASLGALPLPLWALLLEATSQDLAPFLLQVFQVNDGMLFSIF